MLRALTIAAMLALAGCASAVSDSLERRGVDARTVLADRVAAARDDALAAAETVDAAGAALVAVKGLEGADLARQIAAARAAAQDAALAAQAVRLSIDSAGASGDRYFRSREDEIAYYQTPAEQEAARAKLKIESDAFGRMGAALRGASLRLSPALTLLNEEGAVLRENPTSGVAAASRASRIDAAAAAAREASAALRGAAAESSAFLTALGA